MSLNIHPATETVLAELFSSLIVIALGIYFERKKLYRLSIAFNVFGFAVATIITQIDVLVVPLLGFYLLIGVLIAVLRAEWLFSFFGAKIYGALLLAVAVIHTPLAQPIYSSLISAKSLKEGWDILIQFYLWLFAIWLVISVCVWITARVTKRKNKC